MTNEFVYKKIGKFTSLKNESVEDEIISSIYDELNDLRLEEIIQYTVAAY
jgi:hypothetical protein